MFYLLISLRINLQDHSISSFRFVSKKKLIIHFPFEYHLTPGNE